MGAYPQASRSPQGSAPDQGAGAAGRVGRHIAARVIMERQNQSKNQIDVNSPERCAQEVKPLPSPQEIRRQLGWGLLILDQKDGAPRRS